MHRRVKKRGQCFALARCKLLDEKLHVHTDKLLCGRRLPVFTAGRRVAGYAAGCTIAGGGCAVVVALFLPLSARWAFFISHQRSETKNDPLADRAERGQRGWGGRRGRRGKCQTRTLGWRAVGARPERTTQGPLDGPSTHANRSGAKPRVSAT
jgi:hypothetical protein